MSVLAGAPGVGVLLAGGFSGGNGNGDLGDSGTSLRSGLRQQLHATAVAREKRQEA